MLRVSDLRPGDMLTGITPGGEEQAVLIATVIPHPIYPTLCLVIWWLRREQVHSFDALRCDQELEGELVVDTQDDIRVERLRDAMREPR